MKLPEAIFGTWQNDRDRTLTELKRHLRPDHPKFSQLASPDHFFPLTISYTPNLVCYTYRGDQTQAEWRILAHDECTLVSEVEPCWANEQRLWQIHFLSENCYWVSVDLDWGFVYREFFIRVSAPEEIQLPGIERLDDTTLRKN